ncbi:MAG: hypothetical protein JW812_02950 [Alphaproteobacteria bacterium]|nr:hypothetical protein [Alphaproteobacteria bacterium]MBN2779508.1 hypothetical protein [Alphaproteobacteria bacterium]
MADENRVKINPVAQKICSGDVSPESWKGIMEQPRTFFYRIDDPTDIENPETDIGFMGQFSDRSYGA